MTTYDYTSLDEVEAQSIPEPDVPEPDVPEPDVPEPDVPKHLRLPSHLAGHPEPWERDARESERQYQLFMLYLHTAYPKRDGIDPGQFTPRNLRTFARDMGLSYAHICRYSADHHWTARCAAYDRQVDRERTEATLDAVARARLSQARELSMLRELLHDGLASLIDAQRAGTASLKPSDLTAMLKALHDSERVLNGEATSRNEVRVATVNLNDFRRELGLDGKTPEERQREREQLRAAHAKLQESSE